MRKSFYFKITSYILLILSPTILLLLLSLYSHNNVFKGIPVWSDEISYWREVFLFLNHGFKTGYMGLEEMIPRIGVFSTHGFFPAFIYFPFAKIFGWEANGIVIANLVFITICFVILIFTIRPTLNQTIMFIVIYTFYTPILLYTASSMTEILNYGLLILFFSFFYRYFHASSEKEKKFFLVLLLLTGTVCAFYRIIYIILFLLPLVISCKTIRSKKFLFYFLMWIFYSGILYLIYTLYTSPYPYGVLYNVLNTGNINTSIQMILVNIKNNTINFLSINYGDKVEFFQRYFYLFLLILFFVITVFNVNIKKFKKDFLEISIRGKIDRFYSIQFILLFLPLLIVITIYDVYGYRDYRTLAPFIWATMLNIILFKRKTIITFMKPIFILYFFINILFLPSVFPVKEEARYNFKYEKNINKINEIVKYDENAKNPFENTLLTDSPFDFTLWSNLNPGIGIQYRRIKRKHKK